MTFAAFAQLCPGCFADKGTASLCPHCGYDDSLKRGPLVLAHRTLLNHGQYLIGRVLGKPGGFGITYLALDTKLETRVAIKEYLPRDLAGRDASHATISAHSAEDGQFFRYGLTQFLQEARTLAQFDHANIVRVRNFFEENGTGYLVMDYYDGVTLADYLARQPQGRLPEKTAVGILMPILDGLREVHARNFLHRDIKPQNIYLTTSNRPILLDFGAARQAMSERSRSLSVVLSEGYAPYEQYHRRGEQGPWTDIYSCAAVLYHAVAGEPPPPATERVHTDELDFNSLGVSTSLTMALRSGLALDHKNRPQTMAKFQALLLGDGEPPVLTEVVEKKPEKAVQSAPIAITSPRSAKPTTLYAIGVGFVMAMVVVVIGVIWLVMGNRGPESARSESPTLSEVAKAKTKSVDLADAKPAKGGHVTYEVEAGGNEESLLITVEGKRLKGPSNREIKIIAQKDFNGDGVMDALISTWGGGNGYPPEHMIVSIANGKLLTATVALGHAGQSFKIVEENGKFLIQDDFGEQGGAKVFWGFDGQNAIKVRSISYPLKTIETTVNCLKKGHENCPVLFDILRDDKKFKANLSLALNKTNIPIDDWMVTGDISSGIELIKKNNKIYLSVNYHRRWSDNYIYLLLEIDETASSGGRLIAAYFPDTIEPIWVNFPSRDEKLVLIERECSGTGRSQACDLLGK